MPAVPTRVTAIPLPPESAITRAFASVTFADAYAVPLPPDASTDPETLARFIFARHSPAVRWLMAVRDAVVGVFGLKTARALSAGEATDKVARVGIFRIYASTPAEIVMGEDDRHLDFRLSLLCAPRPDGAGVLHVIVTTVVHCHNLFGHVYIRVIAPFHRVIVRGSLRRAAKAGWPAAAGR